MLEYTIYCDRCGGMIDVQTGSARQARRKAKKKGVLVRILRKDYCPECAEKLHLEGEIDGEVAGRNRKLGSITGATRNDGR